MIFRETAIPGCLEILPRYFSDPRGAFVKVFREDAYRERGLPGHFTEAFHSVSAPGVLRGLHFQLPPMAQAKVVWCPAGKVLDAAVDLRAGSPAYGRHVLVELDASRGNGLFLPEGLAHGFHVLSGPAVVAYMVTGSYSPPHEGGILWNSAGIPWPDPEPLLSERDRGFPPLSGFRSPFPYPHAAGKGEAGRGAGPA